ncbi:MAG TPA: hypothetical protein VE998_06545 [Terriglobales bacterium]|nr:hypothetical protein [Terriglobales bacterium]
MPRSRIILSLVVSVFAVSLAQAQTSPAEDHFRRDFPLQPGGTVFVKNYKGLIRIEAADSDQAGVEVKKIWEGHSANQRDQWLREVEVNFNSDPKRLDVRVEYPNHSCFWNCDEWGGRVELVMHVPRQANIEIDGYKPEINISGIRGDVRIHSYKSAIEVRDTTGGIEVDTYKDRIVLENVALRGPLRIHDYKAETEVRARELGDGADLDTSRGAIRLQVPADSRFNVDISGDRRADIRSDFEAHVDAGWSRHITGAVNGGGPEVRIHTDRGTVALLKSGTGSL